ncbi:hypothetical protein [Lactobacillus phage Lenus]|uniref:Uncharacterized protein n=1 Tax=Lactobacillus phage Lenus TaxID=2053682 RepID=A0A2H4PB70_9CAUD|nr:hypothetical protein [Lactobacillus phage Lenus]ATW59484.1 hypothetical protein [Lactobacillus phage Lenus]
MILLMAMIIMFNDFMEESERINWLEQKVEEYQDKIDVLNDKIDDLQYLNEALEQENSYLSNRVFRKDY